MEKTQNLTNDELVQRLAAYGIAVDLKTLPKKRDILIKQLNHAIARNKSPPRNRSPSKKAAAAAASTSTAASSDFDMGPTTRTTRSRASLMGGERLPPPPEPPVPTSFVSTKFPSMIKAPSPSFVESPHSAPRSSPRGAQHQAFETPLGGGLYQRFTAPISPAFSNASFSSSSAQIPVQQVPQRHRFHDLLSKFNLNASNCLIAVVVVAVAILVFSSGSLKLRDKIPPNRQINNEQIVASSADRLLICDNKKFEQPCFPEATVRNCLPVLPSIRSIIDADFLKVRCDGNNAEETYKGIPIQSVIFQAKNAVGKKDLDVDEDALLTLIQANPHWRIQLVNQLGETTNSVVNAFNLRTKDVKLPFACKVKLFMVDALTMLTKALVAFLGAFVFFSLILAFLYTISVKVAYRRNFRKKVHEFAEQIVDAVRKQHEAFMDQTLSQTLPTIHAVSPRPIKDFVVIRHLADTLIPLDQREDLLPAWNAAVELIRSSESRIRTIVRIVDGEHVNVWEWTADKMQAGPQKLTRSPKTASAKANRTPSPNRRGRQSVKGTPVDRSPSGGRRPLPMGSPPGLTPCLKVRGILRNTNPSNPRTLEEAQTRIREAAQSIGGCGLRAILEVHVKTLNDGNLAVYVRCSDEIASGKLTSSLRKSYKDVVVHYLNVDKFNQQFFR